MGDLEMNDLRTRALAIAPSLTESQREELRALPHRITGDIDLSSCDFLVLLNLADAANGTAFATPLGRAVLACLDASIDSRVAPPAEGDPLAEMRAYVANAKAALRPRDMQRYIAAEVAEQMLELAERTVAKLVDDRDSWRRVAHTHAETVRTASAQYNNLHDTLRALVEADQKTDAQLLQRAWAAARERVAR